MTVLLFDPDFDTLIQFLKQSHYLQLTRMRGSIDYGGRGSLL